MTTRRIGILGFENVTALDIVGPADVFATAKAPSGAGVATPPYEIVLIGVDGASFRSDAGLEFKAAHSLATAPRIDTLIIPGGHGLREPATNAKVAAWLRLRADRIRRIASVCTGIYGLAPSGLLDGRRVTTHWRYAADVAEKFPALKVDPDAIYIKDGPFYTAAGVTSAIDLSLALVQEDLGPAVALGVARMLVVFIKRAGGQEQYSEPLRFQTQSGDQFSELSSWIAGHLGADLSVDALARRACMSPRNFSRRFSRAFAKTPAAFVEGLRLDEARRQLTSADASIERIALSVGFTSADSFRRSFERRFLITPMGYRGRFTLRETAS